MKKLCALIFLLTSVNVYSQPLILTPQGVMVDSANKSNDYVIIEIDSMSASDIYKETINFIKLYQFYPEFSFVSNIENQYVRFNTYCKGAFILKQKSMGQNLTYTYNIRYSNEIFIKDGRIKLSFNNLSIDYVYSYTGKTFQVPMIGSIANSAIFNKNGELVNYNKWKMDNPKEHIENYFNDQLKLFISSIQNDNFINDW